MTSTWTREELERAHSHYAETAQRCAETGEWRDWADLFTEDAVYLEHTFGTFHGPDEIYAWIAPLMAEWPNRAMESVPSFVVRLRRGARVVDLPGSRTG